MSDEAQESPYVVLQTFEVEGLAIDMVIDRTLAESIKAQDDPHFYTSPSLVIRKASNGT